jgi:hypothetical protein
VNWSVLVIVALLAYGLAAGQFPAEAPHRPVAEYIVAAIITAVAYIASLLAHELAHSLVARRNGVKVEGITLWLLGGVSRLQGEFPDPGAELRVAGARPLTSLLLAGVLAAGLGPARTGRARRRGGSGGLARRHQHLAGGVQRDPGRPAGRRACAAGGAVGYYQGQA